jgi:asparagine synthase (glutamine-hydrolysing)
MSGICAVWRKDNPDRLASTLASVCGGLSLAAPEQRHRETDLGVGVGVSARFDTQQIYRSERVLIACDADLYNEGELDELAVGRREQLQRPAQIAARLAALYERFGAAFVEKLRGGFSILLWDKRERQLIAAIDGFGIKRLAYFETPKLLVLASRIDALARAGEIDLEINPRAIPNVLNFSVNLGPETIFKQVHRVPPASLLVASNGNLRSTKYWDMRYGVGHDANEEQLGREMESLVESSVAAHCKRDSFDEVGAFLSGGTDSSTVVGMMSRMGRGRVKTFSIGFAEQPFNELGYAEIAARRFNADHHTYLVTVSDCFEALPDMIRSFDEPFGNSSAIPTYFCARLAAGHGVKTLLAGDGGDELFGGNESYATDKLFQVYQDVPGLVRKGLVEPLLGILPFENGLVGKARRYIRRSNLPPFERVMSYHFLCAHSPAEIFDPGFLDALNGYAVLEIPSRYYREAPAGEHLDRLLYQDLKIVIGDSDLPKVTCMSELAGIRPRFPFLDRAVAEFSGRVPACLKVKGFEKRYLFKRAFRKLLPVEIIQKKKHGFGIPVSEWMKTDPKMRELARDTLLSQRAFERGYFRREFIEDLFRKYEADDSSYYGDTIWSFLAVELWHREFADVPVGAGI